LVLFSEWHLVPFGRSLEATLSAKAGRHRLRFGRRFHHPHLSGVVLYLEFFTNYCQIIYSLEYDISFDLSLYIFFEIDLNNFWTFLKAGGIPQPLIHWFKGRTEVIPSNHIGIFNDGTELRISNVKQSDLGAYSCVAKNSEGNLTQFTKLVQAGNLTFSHG
jgi:hypothetical protein